MKIRFVILFMLFFIQILSAQHRQSKFRVDFNEIKGELSSKDLFKKDFGRYDGYEIELFEGEAVNFIAYSKDFQPTIALVNSKGEIIKQSTLNDKGYANIVSAIPMSGNFVLYVIGDEAARGNYTLQTAVAEPNALLFEIGSDLCTTLNLLLSHATAYFFLLENPEFTKGELIILNDAMDAYIDEETGSYNATYCRDNNLLNAEAIFKNTADKIKECLGKEWQISSTNWQIIEDYKEKSKTFIEKTDNKPRYIKIVLKNFTTSKEMLDTKFSVEVMINRKL